MNPQYVLGVAAISITAFGLALGSLFADFVIGYGFNSFEIQFCRGILLFIFSFSLDFISEYYFYFKEKLISNNINNETETETQQQLQPLFSKMPFNSFNHDNDNNNGAMQSLIWSKTDLYLAFHLNDPNSKKWLLFIGIKLFILFVLQFANYFRSNP